MPEISKSQEIKSGSPFVDTIFDASEIPCYVRPSKRNAGRNQLIAAYFRLVKEAVTRLENLLLYGVPGAGREADLEEWLKREPHKSPEKSRRRFKAMEARALARVKQILKRL